MCTVAVPLVGIANRLIHLEITEGRELDKDHFALNLKDNYTVGTTHAPSEAKEIQQI